MTLLQLENGGTFAVVTPRVKPAMRDWVTSWQVEKVLPLAGRRRPGTASIAATSSNSFMPMGKVRRRGNWLSCSARSAIALPSGDGGLGMSFMAASSRWPNAAMRRAGQEYAAAEAAAPRRHRVTALKYRSEAA